jgi:hypothetical protein
MDATKPYKFTGFGAMDFGGYRKIVKGWKSVILGVWAAQGAP